MNPSYKPGVSLYDIPIRKTYQAACNDALSLCSELSILPQGNAWKVDIYRIGEVPSKTKVIATYTVTV
jgi:hypothetical protein